MTADHTLKTKNDEKVGKTKITIIHEEMKRQLNCKENGYTKRNGWQSS
jgi:hypothetical protein